MRIIVAKDMGNNKYDYMGSKFAKDIQTWVKLENVKPGKYVAFVEFNWDKPKVKNSAHFRTYGQKQVKLKEIGADEHPVFLP